MSSVIYKAKEAALVTSVISLSLFLTLVMKAISLITKTAFVFGTMYLWYKEGFSDAAVFAGITLVAWIGLALIFGLAHAKGRSMALKIAILLMAILGSAGLCAWHISVFITYL